MFGLTADVITARRWRAPLALEGFFQDSISSAKARPQVADVALELSLPILDGIPLKELLTIRDGERAQFQRFRAALRTAMEERLAVAKEGDDPADIADAIVRDLVEPELAGIQVRLEAAARAMRRKSAIGLGVGSVVATVGTLLGVPLVLGAGIATATTIQPIYAYFDEGQKIESEDMYFLWKVQRATDRHA